MNWIFLPIDNQVNKDQFDCGLPELNEYLKKYASQNHRKGIATTFVAILSRNNPTVFGYYSVSMSEIQQKSLPTDYQRGLSRYPIPVMRVGKLAVDRSRQGKKLGEELLMECFRKAIRLSSEVGIFAISVDAINQQAKDFYLKYGFISLIDNPLSLFIPISTIKKVIQ
jgi:predicted GNAT family N-acyltransferase